MENLKRGGKGSSVNLLEDRGEEFVDSGVNRGRVSPIEPKPLEIPGSTVKLIHPEAPNLIEKPLKETLNSLMFEEERLKKDLSDLSNKSGVTSLLGAGTNSIGSLVSGEVSKDIVIPVFGEGLNITSLALQGKRLFPQAELIRVLENKLATLNKLEFEEGKSIELSASIEETNKQIASLKTEMQRAIEDLKLGALTETGTVASDALTAFIDHLKESPSSQHLAEILPLTEALSLPQKLLAIKRTAAEIKGISAEKNQLDEQIKQLESEKANEALIEVLEVKRDYLAKIKLGNKAAEMVKNIMSLLKTGGTTGTSIGKATAIKVGAAVVGKALWPLALGALGVSGALYGMNEKANIVNFFKKMPKKRELSRAQSRISDSNEQIKRSQNTLNISQKTVEVQKLALAPTLRNLNEANRVFEKAEKVKLELEEKLNSGTGNRVQLEKMFTKAENEFELALASLNSAKRNHAEMVEKVMGFSSTVEKNVGEFQQRKKGEIVQDRKKIIELQSEMRGMDKKAQEQWKADQVGASVEDMRNATGALNEDLKNPKTRESFINYFADKLDEQGFKKFDENPGQFLMDYMFK